MTYRITMLIAMGVVASTLLMAGCAEGYFELARESRLPRWFQLPSGLSRADVKVTITPYVMAAHTSATIKLWDAQGRQLAKITAILIDVDPTALTKKTPEGNVDAPSYPLYMVMTVAGIAEVIEQREPGPILWVSDDPRVKAALGVK